MERSRSIFNCMKLTLFNCTATYQPKIYCCLIMVYFELQETVTLFPNKDCSYWRFVYFGEMRLNEHTKLVGQRVILVPYEARHVPKYHEWMSCPTLRNLTASDELTLSEEYDMQRSWREDNDKLTFIVLCAETYANTNDEIAAMVGDTNLFLRYDDDEEEGNQYVAEAEIMIAATEARGKGYGREAMLLMFKYAQNHLSVTKFEAKIDMDNQISLRLFESFQFVEVRRVEVFHEVTLERKVTPDWLTWLDQQVDIRSETYK